MVRDIVVALGAAELLGWGFDYAIRWWGFDAAALAVFMPAVAIRCVVSARALREAE